MPVSFDLFVWVVGGVSGAFVVVLWFIVGRLITLREEFAAYQLSAKDRFASVGYLQAVEKRLTDELGHLAGAITRFDETIRGLTQTLSRLEGRLEGAAARGAGE